MTSTCRDVPQRLNAANTHTVHILLGNLWHVGGSFAEAQLLSSGCLPTLNEFALHHASSWVMLINAKYHNVILGKA